MNLIVSTCGTSLLTNAASPDQRATIVQNANAASENNVVPADRVEIRDVISRSETQLTAASSFADLRKTCAELNAILMLNGQRVALPATDEHILVHTSTWLGQTTAELLAAKLRVLGARSVTLVSVAKLSTASLEDFADGLHELVKWAADTLPGYREHQYKVVFSLNGGFKSVIGFMQTLGMFYADETVFVFESGSDLLRVPRLPVDIDAAAWAVMTKYASVFRRMAVLGSVQCTEVTADIPGSLTYQVGSETGLSLWGHVLWQRFRVELYKSALLDSPFDKVKFAGTFSSDIAGLSTDRLAQLNQRVDDLARYLNGPSMPLRRLDVKQLRGNPMPPSTHECDAWADGDARRIFFHYQDGVAVLDCLAKGLH